MSGFSSFFRKAAPPALGPAFDGSNEPNLSEFFPGAPALMFDLSRLTLDDYEQMRHHPQINASLSLLTFMLHQIDWHIECEDPKIAAVVEENLRLRWTQLVRGLSQAYWAGYSPMVLEWDESDDGRWIFVDKIKDLHPSRAWVNWKEEESSYKPPRFIDGVARGNIVQPKIKVFDGMKTFGLTYPIPVEHTLWYPVLREHGDYTGRKLLKPAFMAWYFSLLIHLYSNRYFERFGEPTPIGRAPLTDEYEIKDRGTVTGKQLMEETLQSLRSSGAVVLDSARDPTASVRSEYVFDIEYLESQMRGADFERYLNRLDEEISLAIFTPLLLLRSGDRGSLNLGVQHTTTWLWSINALAADIKEYIDPYVCERIKAFNFSPNAPRVEWVPRSMGRDNAETLRAVITELIRKDKVTPDIEEMGQALGMTLSEVSMVTRAKEAEAMSKAEAAGQPKPDDRLRTERTDRTKTEPNRAGSAGQQASGVVRG